MSKKAKPPLVKETEPPRPKWKVEDPNYYQNGACRGIGDVLSLFSIANEPSASAAAKELRARNVCANCTVRRDCVIEGFLWKDTGVIRGGVRFVQGMHKYPCMLCGLPAAKKGRLCLYCLSKRYCVLCGRGYATVNAEDEPGLCPACSPVQEKSRIKRVVA